MTESTAIVEMNSALEKPKAIEELLATRAEELDVLLTGSGVSRDQFIRGVVLGLANAEPKVLTASRNSILLSVLEAAQMGLVPSGQFGGAYLVKYGKEAELVVDWRGYIKMALRSGQVTKVEAENVYELDEFDYQRGTEEFIRHRPSLGERGRWTHTYAIATLLNGDKQFEVLTAAQVDAIRGGRRAVWVSHPEEMRRKTAVRRLFKYIPQAITPQLEFALNRDDRLDAEAVAEAPQRPNRISRLADRVLGMTPDEAAEVVPQQASGVPMDDEDLPDIPESTTSATATTREEPTYAGDDIEQDDLKL